MSQNLKISDKELSISNLSSEFSIFEKKKSKKTQIGFLPEKIKQAEEMLKNSDPLKIAYGLNDTSEIRKNNQEPALQQIELAILDIKTNEISLNRYWLSREQIIEANKARGLYLDSPPDLPLFSAVNADEKFKIAVNWWNSFNSDLKVINKEDNSENYVVIANKYLWENDYIILPEDKTHNGKYSDIIYVPYSEGLHNEETLSVGKNIVDGYVNKAFSLLEKRKVQSRAFPGKLVTETIDPSFIKNIFVIEHTDPRYFFLSRDGGIKIAQRFLIRLGTNGPLAYRFTVSSVGAAGIAQIMPGTYKYIKRQYPEAYLIDNMDMGRVDLLNSVVASILVFDDHLGSVFRNMSTSQRLEFDKKEAEKPEFINQVRAVIYNGGASKYDPKKTDLKLTNNESFGYIKKFDAIMKFGLFD